MPVEDELDRLIRWYALAWLDEASGIDKLHEGVAEDGAPQWSGKFRVYMLSSDYAQPLDSHYYLKPLHAALATVRRSDPPKYDYLVLLRGSWDRDLVPQSLALPALRYLRTCFRYRAP